MVEQHADCVLAIVGSRDVPKYLAESIIREALVTHKPKMVISGGATGVDTFAVEIAKEAGFLTIEIRPSIFQWDPPVPAGDEAKSETIQPDGSLLIVVTGGFKQRNEHVAEMADCLVRISSQTTKTYGSGWTADRAEALGKNVTRHTAG